MIVRRPDLSIFLSEHLAGLDPGRVAKFAPDIAVEGLSPTEAVIDVNRKSHEYLAADAREIWILDGPNREIAVRTVDGIRLFRESNSLESALLPGFSCSVSELFAGYPTT